MYLQESTVMTSRGKTSPSFCRIVLSFFLFTNFFPFYLLLIFLLSFGLCDIHYTDMLPGLQQGQEKMSKSDPSSAIYMEDEEVQFVL